MYDFQTSSLKVLKTKNLIPKKFVWVDIRTTQSNWYMLSYIFNELVLLT